MQQRRRLSNFDPVKAMVENPNFERELDGFCGDSEMNISICAVTRTKGPASSVKGCGAIGYLYEDLSRK